MQTMSVQQLKQLRNKPEEFLLINTLDKEHFNSTRIPGAVNIPQSDENFVQRVEAIAEKNQKIVTYCANQQCPSSAEGAEKLEQSGFSNVYDFEAGAEGWKQAEGRTVKA